MHFHPTELELAVMRALDTHRWYPAPALADAARLDTPTVRRIIGELRRFELVAGDGRLGAGAAQRYHLTRSGEAALIDALRRRTLAVAA